MTPPIIGICTAFEIAHWGFWKQEAAIVPSTYINKIRLAGGLPIGLIPDEQAAQDPTTLIDRIDALLLIGGIDVEPTFYGEDKTERTEATEPRRDLFELSLARRAMAQDIPILGVCRGMQILNVAAGGTLHQHLGDVGFAEHRRSPGRLDSTTFHEIEVQPGTHAASLSGSGIQVVNSHHHQGVDRLGDGAVVTARSLPDQLPEALEWPDRRYALGVQWHPEAIELEHALTDFVKNAAYALEGNH